jgi:hypothetical protein
MPLPPSRRLYWPYWANRLIHIDPKTLLFDIGLAGCFDHSGPICIGGLDDAFAHIEVAAAGFKRLKGTDRVLCASLTPIASNNTIRSWRVIRQGGRIFKRAIEAYLVNDIWSDKQLHGVVVMFLSGYRYGHSLGHNPIVIFFPKEYRDIKTIVAIMPPHNDYAKRIHAEIWRAIGNSQLASITIGYTLDIGICSWLGQRAAVAI